MLLHPSSDSSFKKLRILFIATIVLLGALMVNVILHQDAEVPLRGQLADIGIKGGRTVTEVSFSQGEISEVLPINHLNIILIPDEQDISDGALLSTALTPSKRIFGYKYSSRNAELEIAAKARADLGEPLTYSELFPGEFFASDTQRSDNSFIVDFEVQKNITFLPPTSVTLNRYSRYVIVAADPQTRLTVRGLSSICGNGTVDLGEQCEEPAALGCSSTCRVGLGDLIIDDGDTGFAITGPWARNTTQGGWKGDRYTVPALNSSTCTSGANCVMQQSATASWTFTGLPAETYEVYVKWRNRETLRPASQHGVWDGPNKLGVSVAFPWENMEKDATNQWGKLGSYAITTGTLKVETSNNVGWFNSQYPAEVIADAVMIRRSICGDGVPEGSEACDDGGVSPGDGCSIACTVESGYSSCSGTPSVCIPIVCGDGKIEGNEVCDDGNPDAGDGCSALCAVEANYRCSRTPSVCQPNMPNVISILANIPTTTESDIAFGSDGLPIIVYFEPLNLKRLVAVHCGNVDCTTGNTSSFVVETSEAKKMPNIAIGSDGLPIITYYKYDEQSIQVIHCTAVDCSSSTAAPLSGTTGEVVTSMSTIIGSDGLPFISYAQNSASPKLTLVHCGDTACTTGNTITTIENENGYFIERHHATTIGADGFPVMAYIINGSLWVRHCVNEACTQSTSLIAERTTTANSITWRISAPVSIALGPQGHPIISYSRIKHTTNYDYPFISILSCGDNACSTNNVIKYPNVNSSEYDRVDAGKATLAVGSDGLPVLSLLDRILHCDTATCDGNTTFYTPISPRPMSQVSCTIGHGATPMCTYYIQTDFTRDAKTQLMFLRCGDHECYTP